MKKAILSALLFLGSSAFANECWIYDGVYIAGNGHRLRIAEIDNGGLTLVDSNTGDALILDGVIHGSRHLRANYRGECRYGAAVVQIFGKHLAEIAIHKIDGDKIVVSSSLRRNPEVIYVRQHGW